LLSLGFVSFAQFDPQGAEVISYFPHFADGGPANGKWTTSLTLVNPNQSLFAAAIVNLYDNNGMPLSLNFGNGPISTFTTSIPPQGSVTYKTIGASPSTVTGWAIVDSSLPVQGLIQFNLTSNGTPQAGVSSVSTLASSLFRSPATFSTGFAIANIYTNISLPVTIAAKDTNGNTVANTTLTVAPLGHQSFNLSQVLPLTTTFRGSVIISTSLPDGDFVAWNVSADGGFISSYPPSGLNWPVSHYERIWKVWQKVVNAVPPTVVNLTPLPALIIDYTTSAINSYAVPSQNQVHIFMNLAELISDSDSELGFVIGHELGHIIQGKIGNVWVSTNVEYDADQWGMILSLLAGYDPYGAAGALAKLSMASGEASLLSQTFDNLNLVVGLDLHGSFDNRLALVFQNMQAICGTPQLASFCAEYKSAIHPHLPGSVPLSTPGTRPTR